MQQEGRARTVALAVLAICALSLTATIGALAWRPVKGWYTGATGPFPATYATGERIDVPASIFEGAPRTLLVFARASCPACEQSKPVLLTLIDQGRKMPGLRLALVTKTGLESDAERYARELGFRPEELQQIGTERLRLQRIPAIALVDRDGRVLKFHEGVLTDEQRSWLADVPSSPIPHR